jgi:hypothetical protein
MTLINTFLKNFKEPNWENISLHPEQDVQVTYIDGHNENILIDTRFTHIDLLNFLKEIIPDNCKEYIEQKKDFSFSYKDNNVDEFEINVKFIDEISLITIHKDTSQSIQKLKKHKDFPSAIPSILNFSEKKQKRRSTLISFIISLFIIIISHFVLGRESLIGQILDPTKLTVIVPFTIFWLFFWGLFITYYKRKYLKAIEKVSPKILLIEAAKLLPTVGINELLEELEGDVIRKSPLLKRLEAILIMDFFKLHHPRVLQVIH